MGIQTIKSSKTINMKAFVVISALLAIAAADQSSHATIQHGHGPVVSHAIHKAHGAHHALVSKTPVHPAAVHPVHVAHHAPLIHHAPLVHHAPVVIAHAAPVIAHPLHTMPQPLLHTTPQLPLTTSQLHTTSPNSLLQYTDMNTPLPMTTARLPLLKMRLVMVTRPPAHTVLLFPTAVPKLLPTASTMLPLVMSLMLHTKE